MSERICRRTFSTVFLAWVMAMTIAGFTPAAFADEDAVDQSVAEVSAEESASAGSVSSPEAELVAEGVAASPSEPVVLAPLPQSDAPAKEAAATPAEEAAASPAEDSALEDAHESTDSNDANALAEAGTVQTADETADEGAAENPLPATASVASQAAAAKSDEMAAEGDAAEGTVATDEAATVAPQAATQTVKAEASAQDTAQTSANTSATEGSANASTKAPAATPVTTEPRTTVSDPSGRATPLEAGIYTIQSAVSGTYVLDVAAGSTKSGGNVQIYNTNKTDAQRWRISYDSEGYYTISSVKSGMLLDLSAAKVRNGQNIWQYEGNDTIAQKWVIAKSGNGYTIASAKNENYVVDVFAARAQNSTNVQLYQANGTPAQRWWFIPEAPALKSQRTVEDGVYEVLLAKSSAYGLDLVGQSADNNANVQLYADNNTVAQRWAITRESDGYYTVKSVSSGKAIEVAAGSVAARANVSQYSDNGTAAQRWAIEKNSDGSFTFLNKKTGLALDIADAKAANGTNARVHVATRGASQRFTLKAADVLPEDVYALYTMLAPAKQVVDTPAGSQKAGTQEQLYTANGTMAQKFVFRRVGANTYAIQNVYSGMYLEDNNGAVVQRKRSTAASAQKWKASFERAGVVLENTTTGQRMAAAGGKSANGTSVVTAAKQSGAVQRWRARGVSLLANGYYTVTNKAGSKVLDIASGSLANGANVQVYSSNGTAAQIFEITAASDGYYKMINDASGKAVEVAGGSKSNGANVQQNTWSNTARQLWKPELREDGALVFVNKASGKALDVYAGSTANGANVQSYEKNGTPAQGWSLKATQSAGISGNAELDRYIRQVAASNGNNLRKCFDWTVNNIRWTNSVSGEVLANGVIGKQKTINYALYAFRNHRGDCYYYASAFKWLAIACGYSAEARAGRVPSASQGLAAHGWTEVYRNGTTYICDANLAIDIPGYNWYMVTYDNAPVAYYR